MSCAGLVPVLALAHSCGLGELVADRVSVPSPNADLKIPALVAGMVAGADSIEDMELLRHGGMGRLFDGVRAPSTLGTFLRTFTFGHVRQLDAVAARLLAALACRTRLLAAAADQVCFLDVNDTMKPTYDYLKQGAGYGYSKVKGINALIAPDQPATQPRPPARSTTPKINKPDQNDQQLTRWIQAQLGAAPTVSKARHIRA